MQKLALIVTALMLTPSAAALAQSAPSPSEYVKAAGAGDLYEITSSRVVLASTTDPKVKQFATMMIRHHTKSTADVKAAAMKAKLHPAAPALMPAQSEMIAQLRAESGPARDQTYIAQQKTSHGQALALQQGYASRGTSAPLKMAAAKIVPVVKSHIAMLDTM